MAQRSNAGSPAARSTLQSGYEDPKAQFDKRCTLETKKIKELLNAVEKGRAQLEAERKAYCVELKKQLVAYCLDQNLFTMTYQTTIQGIVKKLDELDKHYQQAIGHMQEVAMPALGFLPKRFEILKKSIKVSGQVKEEQLKIRDFEYERIENIKYALLHFFNARMYLHAKALELYSQAYDAMRHLNIKTEFRNADMKTLREVIGSNPQVLSTPRGGSASGRGSSQGSDRAGSAQASPQRNASRQQQPPGRQQQQQQPQARGGQQAASSAAQRTQSAGAGQRNQSAGAQQQRR